MTDIDNGQHSPTDKETEVAAADRRANEIADSAGITAPSVRCNLVTAIRSAIEDAQARGIEQERERVERDLWAFNQELLDEHRRTHDRSPYHKASALLEAVNRIRSRARKANAHE